VNFIKGTGDFKRGCLYKICDGRVTFSEPTGVHTVSGFSVQVEGGKVLRRLLAPKVFRSGHLGVAWGGDR